MNDWIPPYNGQDPGPSTLHSLIWSSHQPYEVCVITPNLDKDLLGFREIQEFPQIPKVRRLVRVEAELKSESVQLQTLNPMLLPATLC